MFEGFSERMTFMNPPTTQNIIIVRKNSPTSKVDQFVWREQNHYLWLSIHYSYVSLSIFNINTKWANLPFGDFHHCCRKSDMCQNQSDATTTYIWPPLSPKFCSSFLKTLDYVKFQQWPLLYRTAQLSLLSFSLWKNLWQTTDLLKIFLLKGSNNEVVTHLFESCQKLRTLEFPLYKPSW